MKRLIISASIYLSSIKKHSFEENFLDSEHELCYT